MKLLNSTVMLLLLLSPLMADNKHLILAQGDAWLPSMPKNLIQNHDYIEKLPFSGFIMVGNTFTNITMKRGVKLTYNEVWDEVKGLKNLYKEKTENFLRVDITFPGDFWDREAWQQVNRNFEVLAMVAKDLGFKGIAIDDEGYGPTAKKMINYKFPTEDEVMRNPRAYREWQRKGAQYKSVDSDGYSNPLYTFKEHMTKVTSLFKDIMISMQRGYPDITVLVYYGASFAHENANLQNLTIVNLGRPSEQEYKGPMFLGLKHGRVGKSTLHDMAENYRYREEKHFKQSYLLRKFKMATNAYNHNLNDSYQWVVPREDRRSWFQNVNVGFMTSNIPLPSDYPEFDTTNRTTKRDIFQATNFALKYSDKYVIYYSSYENWLLPNKQKNPSKRWVNMVKALQE